MPPRASKPKPKGLFRTWLAEWPKIAATLTVSLILFLTATASNKVRAWIWPPIPPYPVICTAEPVWLGGDKRLVQIYLINTASEPLTSEDLRDRLRQSLGKDGGDASPAVLFPYLSGEPHAQSALADDPFNRGKGELRVAIQPNGVRVEPRQMDGLAILRVNVLFAVDNPDPEFTRAMKGTNGIFDLKGPETRCYTGP
jgi:hypothetical protein